MLTTLDKPIQLVRMENTRKNNPLSRIPPINPTLRTLLINRIRLVDNPITKPHLLHILINRLLIRLPGMTPVGIRIMLRIHHPIIPPLLFVRKVVLVTYHPTILTNLIRLPIQTHILVLALDHIDHQILIH